MARRGSAERARAYARAQLVATKRLRDSYRGAYDVLYRTHLHQLREAMAEAGPPTRADSVRTRKIAAKRALTDLGRTWPEQHQRLFAAEYAHLCGEAGLPATPAYPTTHPTTCTAQEHLEEAS